MHLARSVSEPILYALPHLCFSQSTFKVGIFPQYGHLLSWGSDGKRGVVEFGLVRGSERILQRIRNKQDTPFLTSIVSLELKSLQNFDIPGFVLKIYPSGRVSLGNRPENILLCDSLKLHR